MVAGLPSLLRCVHVYCWPGRSAPSLHLWATSAPQKHSAQKAHKPKCRDEKAQPLVRSRASTFAGASCSTSHTSRLQLAARWAASPLVGTISASRVQSSFVRLVLGDAPPSEPRGLPVKLTPPAGNNQDAEAQRLAERTTLTSGDRTPVCHWQPELSDFRHVPRQTPHELATRSQHATRAPMAVDRFCFHWSVFFIVTPSAFCFYSSVFLTKSVSFYQTRFFLLEWGFPNLSWAFLLLGSSVGPD